MSQELYDILFNSVNTGLTVLVILLVFYWTTTIITGIEADIDLDIDVDMDLDPGIEGGNVDFDDISNVELQKDHVVPDRRKNLKWWQIVLIYFNFVGLPFMFTLTTFIFTWWLLSSVLTSLTQSYQNSMGLGLMLLSCVPALFITKGFTNPFKRVFKKLNKDGDVPIDFLGRKGVSLSTIKDDKMGNAEIIVDGSPMSIYIKSLDGAPISYQDPILIIKEAGDKQFYYAKKYQD